MQYIIHQSINTLIEISTRVLSVTRWCLALHSWSQRALCHPIILSDFLELGNIAIKLGSASSYGEILQPAACVQSYPLKYKPRLGPVQWPSPQLLHHEREQGDRVREEMPRQAGAGQQVNIGKFWWFCHIISKLNWPHSPGRGRRCWPGWRRRTGSWATRWRATATTPPRCCSWWPASRPAAGPRTGTWSRSGRSSATRALVLDNLFLALL